MNLGLDREAAERIASLVDPSLRVSAVSRWDWFATIGETEALAGLAFESALMV